MSSIPALEKTLREHGQNVTATRRSVYVALQGEEPLSMHDLVARCPTVDRASVYRTVALFEKLGIVQRLQTGWKYKLELTGDFHDHHHHATCLRCGQSLVVPEDAAIEEHLQRLARNMGFRLERHQLELSGICQNCQNS